MQAHKLSAQTIARIDEICDRFETAQQEHQTPRIEEYLNEIEQMAQAALFEELLKVELHYRRRNGDHPQPPEYISRFGRWADVVYRVFGSHPLEVGESISQTQTVSDLAREYDELWDMATGTMPDVFDFLQSHPDATPADQASVAQIDQFHRWKRDSRVQTILTVEQYAERLPDIAEDAQLMQELVRAEWEYLLQDQVAKQRQNFVDRFPRLSDAVLEFPLLQPKATTVSKTTSPQADSSRFRPLHLIGQGGLGEVYLAEDRELERQVALKNVRPPHNKEALRLTSWLGH